MASVYILYANSLDLYYVGSCHDLAVRLEQHSSKVFKDSFTASADDWQLFFFLNDLDYRQAHLIETHIKKMKSRKYTENLKRFPEISQKLMARYK